MSSSDDLFFGEERTATRNHSAVEIEQAVRNDGSPYTLLLHHQHGIQTFHLEDGEQLVIGRSPSAGIYVSDKLLSRQHACFQVTDGALWLRDLGSTNGTRLEGAPIAGPTCLNVGNEVTLGSATILVHRLSGASPGGLGVDSHDRFLTVLEDEVKRARQFGRQFAVLMVVARDGSHVARWVEAVRELLRPVDRAAIYNANALELILPELPMARALEVAQAVAHVRGATAQPLRCGLALFPDAGTTSEALLAYSRRAARQTSPTQPVSRPRPATGSFAAVGKVMAAPRPVVMSPKMQELYLAVDQLAASAIPVMIFGETGTGKELVAQAIHARGPRRAAPLIPINCGAIPEQLIESALFGHERGAFTGAHKLAQGIFESANGGTVFLDEIGELPPAAQAAMLRVLETQRITRVGSSRPIEVDVRVVAATHRDLERMCQEGTFRWDLYYRLSALPLDVPPLRERSEEILPLAQRFIEQANRSNGRSIQEISEQAAALLKRYHWPGNVRELRNVIDRAVVVAKGSVIGEEDLIERVRGGGAARLFEPLPLGSEAPAQGRPGRNTVPEVTAIERIPELAAAKGDDAGEPGSFKQRVLRWEAAILDEALGRCGWNKAAVARELQIPLRTLTRKVASCGLQQGRPLDGADLQGEPPQVLALVGPAGGQLEFKERVLRCEHEVISAALERWGGNKTRAAEALKIPLRTLLNKIKVHGLERGS